MGGIQLAASSRISAELADSPCPSDCHRGTGPGPGTGSGASSPSLGAKEVLSSTPFPNCLRDAHTPTIPSLSCLLPGPQPKIVPKRLLDLVQKDVLEIFPQLQGHVLHTEIRGIVSRGLSHTPERYAAKGLRPESPYPGLFVGGLDLTVGGSASAAMVAGWLTATAVMGYSYIDLWFLGQKHYSR